jgi:hypothetical protein
VTPFVMRLRGAGDGGEDGGERRSRRARKRRYWRSVPSSAANSSHSNAPGGADSRDGSDLKAKRERRAVADGVQGVLVTTNSFAASWRSRASHECIGLLSNAAQELLQRAASSASNASRTGVDAGIEGARDTAGGGDRRGPDGERGARGRKPSKYRRVAEQAATAFRDCDSNFAVVDAWGDVRSRRSSDAFSAEQDPGAQDRGQLASGQVRMRPMKVDLRSVLPPALNLQTLHAVTLTRPISRVLDACLPRGAVFVRVEGSIPPPGEPAGMSVRAARDVIDAGSAAAMGGTDANGSVVDLVKYVMHRLSSAVAPSTQTASDATWQSGQRVALGRHVCKMIPITRYPERVSLQLAGDPLLVAHPPPPLSYSLPVPAPPYPTNPTIFPTALRRYPHVQYLLRHTRSCGASRRQAPPALLQRRESQRRGERLP